jgi:hypothetical protein
MQNDQGIATVYVDGVSQGTIDTYSSGSLLNQIGTLSINIPTDGIHTLTFTVTGKNGSSSGYGFVISAWWLIDV